jgi:AbiV family abortive infection protein
MNPWEILKPKVEATFLGGLSKGPLTLEAVAAGMTTCYLNAESLLDDVRLLASRGRLPRALALTILVLEELAKVPDLHDTAVRAALIGSELEWPALWRRYVNHKPKQEKIRDYGKTLKEQAPQPASSIENPLPYSLFLPEEIASVLEQVKQRCFYSDHWNSTFHLPSATLLRCLISSTSSLPLPKSARTAFRGFT